MRCSNLKALQAALLIVSFESMPRDRREAHPDDVEPRLYWLASSLDEAQVFSVRQDNCMSNGDDRMSRKSASSCRLEAH